MTANEDPATSFARELAKQLPVKDIYQDTTQPAAKQLGSIGEDIVKTISLALAPIQVVAAYQDRLREFIDRSVRKVPEKNRLSPPPQILGPIVEGIRYEPADTPIDALFSNLLASSMDASRHQDAHPAFPLLIKQLSKDEAVILSSLKKSPFTHVAMQSFDIKTNLFFDYKVEQDELPKDELQFPNNVMLYMEHLDKLGLAGLYQDGNQQPLFDANRTAQTGVRIFSKYRLTSLGGTFMRACSP